MKKWGNKFKGRVSCYIKGKKPNFLPHIKIGRAKSIKLRIYQDEINETQKRALEIPKCYACFQYGHNVIQCPIAQKERAKYIKEIVKRINISQNKRKELIKNWKFKPKLCSNCGQKKHENETCPNVSHCIVCKEDGHKSGKKSLECKKLITLAKATLRFDYQFNKCCVAENIIPPLPLNGEDYKLNVPWVFNKQWNPITNKWTIIDGWRQEWDKNCNNDINHNELDMEIDNIENKNDKNEIEDGLQANHQSYRKEVNQKLEKFKRECKMEMERLQTDLKEKKQEYNDDVARMKKEYQNMKKHIENTRKKVDKLTMSENELTKKCKKLVRRVNKMKNDLNKGKNNDSNSNTLARINANKRESERNSDTEPSSSTDTPVQNSDVIQQIRGSDRDENVSMILSQGIGMDNRELISENDAKYKDEDKRAKEKYKKRKYVSPHKQSNSNSNTPNSINAKPTIKKRRTISEFKKKHDKVVENNNSVFNQNLNQLTIEQAADGINPAPSANLLPPEPESKDDISSAEEEEDDDDVIFDDNNEMNNYMNTRIDNSNNNGTARRDNSSSIV